MCGIVGYVGDGQAAPVLLQGLEKLEYRGYDSAGVAVYDGTSLQVVKAKGRLKILNDMIDGGKSLPGNIGIGHTRWATHGAPSDVNSHPQVSGSGKLPLSARVPAPARQSLCFRDGHRGRGPIAGLLLPRKYTGGHGKGIAEGGGILCVGGYLCGTSR